MHYFVIFQLYGKLTFHSLILSYWICVDQSWDKVRLVAISFELLSISVDWIACSFTGTHQAGPAGARCARAAYAKDAVPRWKLSGRIEVDEGLLP